jgi:hypothetical protein
MACRALEQAHAEAGFELLYRIGDGRARQASVFGGKREAAAFHDPAKHPHGIKSVHLFVRNSRIVMPDDA